MKVNDLREGNDACSEASKMLAKKPTALADLRARWERLGRGFKGRVGVGQLYPKIVQKSVIFSSKERQLKNATAALRSRVVHCSWSGNIADQAVIERLKIFRGDANESWVGHGAFPSISNRAHCD